MEPTKGGEIMRRLGVIGLGVLLAAVTAGAAEQASSVTGEVVDTFCYATMGAKGAGHKQCALDCARKGIPVGLLEKGTDKLYVLLPNKDKTALPEEVMNKMAETVTITGHAQTKGGSNFLTVESVK
jgi:hypothetical protein